MNWFPGGDYDLLRQAWPDGYLNMQGVNTVGGWHCFTATEGAKFDGWVKGNKVYWLGRTPVTAGADDRFAIQAKIDEGEFLPNVDPADPATWACVLFDLAEAAGVKHSIHATGFQWSRDAGTGIWSLDYGGDSGLAFDRLFADGPGHAAVLARIRVREAA